MSIGGADWWNGSGYQQGRGEKVPLPGGTDGTRPVIMLMAPTRDNEINRLKNLLLDGKKGYFNKRPAG